MGGGSAACHARCGQHPFGLFVQRAAGEHPATAWHRGSAVGLNSPLVIGLLVASFTCPTYAWADACLSSADAVRHQHPESWPRWTLRTPGHEGSKCWYAGTRSTEHQQLKRTAETSPPAPQRPRAIIDPPRATEAPAANPLWSGLDAATLRLTTAIPTEAASDENGDRGAYARAAFNFVSSMPNDDLEQQVVASFQDGFRPQNSIKLERKTDQASFMTAVVVTFGVALVFASVLAGILAGRRRPTGPQRTRYSAEGARFGRGPLLVEASSRRLAAPHRFRI